MLVTKKEGDWWTGVIADRSGIFPSNYVQKADTQVYIILKCLIFFKEQYDQHRYFFFCRK